MSDMAQDTQKLSESEAAQQYADYLDEVCGEVSVAGLSYMTSRVLADVDPIAYRTGFNDWLDAEGIEVVYD